MKHEQAEAAQTNQLARAPDFRNAQPGAQDDALSLTNATDRLLVISGAKPAKFYRASSRFNELPVRPPQFHPGPGRFLGFVAPLHHSLDLPGHDAAIRDQPCRMQPCLSGV